MDTSPVSLDVLDEITTEPEAPSWLLPEARCNDPPDAVTALPPLTCTEPPMSSSLSPNEWPPVKTISPPLPPSVSSELRPDPADMAMLPPAEASLLELPAAICTSPPAAPESPETNRIEPGFPSVEGPV